MTRSELRTLFRTEYPDVTAAVVSDTRLDSWFKQANRDFCMLAKCIFGSGSWTSVEDDESYSLINSDATSYIENYYEIDEFPGGGVAYNGDRLKFRTKSQLDHENRSWRSNSAGTPKYYFERNGSIYFDRPIGAAVTIDVDAVLYPDDFDNDNEEPFNGYAHLQGFSYGLVHFCGHKAKQVKGKEEEQKAAFNEYLAYAQRARTKVKKGAFGAIQLKIPG